MSQKSVFKYLSVVLMLIMVLSACSPGGATDATPPAGVGSTAVPNTGATQPAGGTTPQTAAKPSGNLVIWVQQANQDVFEKTLLPNFQQEYPDIQVEFVNYPPAEVANQMALAIQGGTGGPDLGITENASLGRLVELGGLMDLTQRMEPYRAQMNEPAMNVGTQEGKVYSVPWDIGPVVTFYRRDIFKAAGLSDDPQEVSEMISTWDKYLQTCLTIKQQTGLMCFANNRANNYGTMFFNMTWQQGLDLYSDEGEILIDRPEYVAALEKMGQFWENDVVSDDLEWTDNWYAVLKSDIDDPNVKPVATQVMGAWMGNFLKTWVAGEQSGNWGVARMPTFTEGGTRAANQGGSSAFIPANSSNPEAAWAFLEFMLLRPENHVKLFEYSDYFPSFEATYTDPLFDRPDEYFGNQVTRRLYADVAKEIPVANQYGPYFGTISSSVASSIQKYAMGQMSAEAALKEAANNIRTETGMR